MADQVSKERGQRADLTDAERAHILAEKIIRVRELVGRILSLMEGGADYNRLKEMHELVGRLIVGVPAESLEGVPVAGMESKVLVLARKAKA